MLKAKCFKGKLGRGGGGGGGGGEYGYFLVEGRLGIVGLWFSMEHFQNFLAIFGYFENSQRISCHEKSWQVRTVSIATFGVLKDWNVKSICDC